jgi:N-methylhydantoinase A
MEKYEVELLGYPVLIPGIDVRSVGAGGGSIARVDAGGMLLVGPQSSGSVPGPMCYGQGGIQPTVTDAAVVNGLIDPDYFAGGEIRLDKDLAGQGVYDLSKQLNLNINQTADGILVIARNNMTTATGEILIRQGYDPRDFAIMSFGGGGGLFAAGIARDIGITRVIIPPNPGVFCAWGMLTMDLIHGYSRTYFRSVDDIDLHELTEIFQDMENVGLNTLAEEKIDRKDISFIWSLDMCYEGQGHYVEVPLAGGELREEAKPEIIKLFHHLHKIKYGHQIDAPPRVINVRMKAVGKVKEMRIKPIRQGKSIPPGAVKTRRKVYLDGSFVECDIYDRYKLLGGNTIAGPAIIEEPFHVTLVMSGQTVNVDRLGNLIIDTRSNRK